MGLILFRILYFFLFFGLSSISGMLIPFLQYKGYDPVGTGILISLYTISGMIGQFAVGFVCDKLRTIKKIFYPSIIILMISGSIAIFFKIKLIFFIGFMIMGCSNYILSTLCDSWVMENQDGIKTKFGSLRSWGSVGWAFGVLISGFVISNFGYSIINIMYLVTLGIALVATMKLKDTQKECKGSVSIKELFVNKDYILTIAILLLIGISYRGYCQVLPYTIESIGGNTSNLGIYNFISSVSEIIMLIFCAKIMRKFSPDKLLILAPIAIIIQYLIMYFIPDIRFIYLSGVLQIFTYPLILMVGRIMIDRVSPVSLKTSSQLIAFAIFNSLAIIIGSIVVGYLIENMGVKNSILSLTIFTLLGILGALYYDRKIKDRTL